MAPLKKVATSIAINLHEDLRTPGGFGFDKMVPSSQQLHVKLVGKAQTQKGWEY